MIKVHRVIMILSILIFMLVNLSACRSSHNNITENNDDNMFIFQTISCDFDGDGKQETIEIKCALSNYETIIIESSGGSINFKEILDLAPFQNIDPATAAIDLDGDGGEELIIIANTGAAGGWGGKSLTILTLDDETVKQIHIGGLFGYSANGTLLDNFTAEIKVAETGNTFTYEFDDSVYFIQENFYDEDGVLLKEGSVILDAICYVNIDTDSRIIEIGQFLWSEMHANGNEFLITKVEFNKAGVNVVSQYVEKYDNVVQFLGQG